MKRKHMVVIGALTICGSLLVSVPSSFAVKSMDDKEMDRTTAAGQPRVSIGNGNQTILDSSLYSVLVDEASQAAIVGDSVVNIAGENNVAVAINVANVDAGGMVDQLNEIEQTRNAQVDVSSITWDDGVTSGGDHGDVTSGDMTIDTLTASADHVKIGHGDQTEEDDSAYSVEILGGSQADATVLSMVNGAGRNNVAVAVNAANENYVFGATGVTTITQLNSIIQGN